MARLAISSTAWSLRYSAYGTCALLWSRTVPGAASFWSAPSTGSDGAPALSVCSRTCPMRIAIADTPAANAARKRWRASQSSCCCGFSVSGWATGAIRLAAALGRARRAAERAARRAAAEARRLGSDIVAAGDARELLAREQEHVEHGRREADRGLHAAAIGELSRCPEGHAGRF